MASNTFSFSCNIFGFIMGGITLLGLLMNVVRFHLPSNKIKVLELLLDETETFFKKAIEDGLLNDPICVRDTQGHLSMLKDRTCNLQSLAYNATTLRRDYTEFFKGTSIAIGATCQSLKMLRAEVISSSGKRRRALMEMGAVTQPQTVPSTLPLHPKHVDYPNLPPAAQIGRPRSCPPVLSTTRSLDDPQSLYTLDSPFSDSEQIGSDAQSTDVQKCASNDYTSSNLELEA